MEYDYNEPSVTAQGNPELTDRKENVLMGAVGALLLSLVGGAAVFGLLQLGYIAGIAGLVGFLAAYWGYRKFSGAEGSKTGIVISVVFTLISLLAGLYLGYCFQVFQELKDYEITFADAVSYTKTILSSNSEVRGDVIKDALMLLLFTALACFFAIRSSLKKAR